MQLLKHNIQIGILQILEFIFKRVVLLSLIIFQFCHLAILFFSSHLISTICLDKGIQISVLNIPSFYLDSSNNLCYSRTMSTKLLLVNLSNTDL